MTSKKKESLKRRLFIWKARWGAPRARKAARERVEEDVRDGVPVRVQQRGGGLRARAQVAPQQRAHAVQQRAARARARLQPRRPQQALQDAVDLRPADIADCLYFILKLIN